MLLINLCAASGAAAPTSTSTSAPAPAPTIDKSSELKIPADYYSFGGKNDTARFELPAIKGTVLAWSNADRQVINREAQFAFVHSKTLTSRSGKLVFFRVSEILDAELKKLDTISVTAAATTPGAIFFSDDFFKLESTEQRFFFLHELVHASDMGNLIANHPKFVSYASRMHAAQKLKPKEVEPLAETLADSFAFYIRGDRGFERKRFESEVAPMLLADENSYTKFNLIFSKGLLAQNRRRFSEAIKSMKEAASLFPRTPWPHMFLAYNYLKLRDLPSAIKENEIAESCFNEAGIPLSEPRKQAHMMTRAMLLMQNKNFVSARKILDQLIAFQPNNKGAKSLRSICLTKLGKRKSALQQSHH
jgi:tetratricopeptide (TPR) repeat protein